MCLVRLLLALCVGCSCALCDTQQRITAALEAFDQGEAVESSLLSGGMDHVMVRVRFEGGLECVVRLLKEGRSQWVIDREVEVSRLAGERGIGPKVYFYDPALRVLILEYLPPEECPIKEDLMVLKLRRLYQVDTLSSMEASLPYSFIAHCYKRLALSEPTAMRSLVAEAYAIVEKIQSALEGQPKGVCHGDFHANNVIFSSGDVFLIDWTTAGLGDRFYDLAKFTLPMPLEQRERLFSLYCGGDPTPTERAHFYLMRMATLMTIVVNRYASIQAVTQEAFESEDFTDVKVSAMDTPDACRRGALKALKLFLEMSQSEEFTHSLMTLALTSAA